MYALLIFASPLRCSRLDRTQSIKILIIQQRIASLKPTPALRDMVLPSLSAGGLISAFLQFGIWVDWFAGLVSPPLLAICRLSHWLLPPSPRTHVSSPIKL